MASPHPEYKEGNTITLSLDPDNYDAKLFDGPLLEVRITKLFHPISNSPAMQVEAKTRHGTWLRAVLKTYDRRHGAPNGYSRAKLTGEHNPWTPTKERAWEACVASGRAAQLFARFDTDFTTGDLWYVDDDDDGENEARHQYLNNADCANEARMYRRMESIQGSIVPRFYAAAETADSSSPFFRVGAILIEYIDGVTLARNSGHESLLLGEEFKESVRAINRCGVIDFDRRGDNVLLERDTMRLVHIDFAISGEMKNLA